MTRRARRERKTRRVQLVLRPSLYEKIAEWGKSVGCESFTESLECIVESCLLKIEGGRDVQS